MPSLARAWGIRLIALTLVVWLSSLEFGFQTGLIILTAVGFALAVVGLRRPALGLFGIVILCTLDAVSRIYLATGGLFRWNTFNYWLLVVIAFHLESVVRLKGLQVRLLQIFLVLLSAELLFSADRMGGAQHVLNLASIFGLIVYFVRARADEGAWYWSAMLSGVVSGLGGAVFFLQEATLPDINPNAWSFFPLTSLFAACVFLARPGHRRPTSSLALLVVLNAVWVFLSGSRGSSLIALICLLFILVRLGSLKRVTLAGIAAAFVVLVIAIQAGGLERHATERFEALFDSDRTLTSRTSGRWDLAVGGWRMFRDEPLGIGTGGFPHAWAALQARGQTGVFQGETMQAHSAWIKILAENGVPGILLLTAFVLSFAVDGWRRKSAGAFLPGALVTIAWSVAFLADEFQGKGLWYLGGAILVLTTLAADALVPARLRRPGAGATPADVSGR